MKKGLNESILIRSENESLLRNEKVLVVISDNHERHVLGHEQLFNSPKIGLIDEQTTANIKAHIDEHLKILGREND